MVSHRKQKDRGTCSVQRNTIREIRSEKYDQRNTIREIRSEKYDQGNTTREIRPEKYDQRNTIREIWSEKYDQRNTNREIRSEKYDQRNTIVFKKKTLINDFIRFFIELTTLPGSLAWCMFSSLKWPLLQLTECAVGSLEKN